MRRLHVEHWQVGDVVFILVEDGHAGIRGHYTVYRVRCGQRPTVVGRELPLRDARLMVKGLWP